MPERIIEQPGNKEALALWQKVTLKQVKHGPYDLSARQFALLATIAIEGRVENHTVRGLSQSLGVSKPAICRALDSLSRMGLAKREVDREDRRNVWVRPTDEAYEYLGSFSEDIMVMMAEM